MKYKITKEFSFDSAHRLGDTYKIKNKEKIFGKCSQLHGHGLKLFVTVGSNDLIDGMVVNFVELKKIVQEKIINELDHKFLNEVSWLKGSEPTCEIIIEKIWERLVYQFPDRIELIELKLYETPTSFCVYKGEKHKKKYDIFSWMHFINFVALFKDFDLTTEEIELLVFRFLDKKTYEECAQLVERGYSRQNAAEKINSILFKIKKQAHLKGIYNDFKQLLRDLKKEDK
jgi:6-pyruvoyltetrahydropterin/6-carboxytetrahydropterin synthase